jgi:hypothetical protein
MKRLAVLLILTCPAAFGQNAALTVADLLQDFSPDARDMFIVGNIRGAVFSYYVATGKKPNCLQSPSQLLSLMRRSDMREQLRNVEAVPFITAWALHDCYGLLGADSDL